MTNILKTNLERQKLPVTPYDDSEIRKIKKANQAYYRTLPRYYDYDRKGNLKGKK